MNRTRYMAWQAEIDRRHAAQPTEPPPSWGRTILQFTGYLVGAEIAMHVYGLFLMAVIAIGSIAPVFFTRLAGMILVIFAGQCTVRGGR